MVDGTYRVFADTPLGRRQGVLTLRTTGGKLTARLTIRGATASISSAEPVGEDGFRAAGTLRSLLGSLSFSSEGSVHGDELTCRATTTEGSFTIAGTRRASKSAE